jgi:hypothetical protein
MATHGFINKELLSKKSDTKVYYTHLIDNTPGICVFGLDDCKILQNLVSAFQTCKTIQQHNTTIQTLRKNHLLQLFEEYVKNTNNKISIAIKKYNTTANFSGALSRFKPKNYIIGKNSVNYTKLLDDTILIRVNLEEYIKITYKNKEPTNTIKELKELIVQIIKDIHDVLIFQQNYKIEKKNTIFKHTKVDKYFSMDIGINHENDGIYVLNSTNDAAAAAAADLLEEYKHKCGILLKRFKKSFYEKTTDEPNNYYFIWLSSLVDKLEKIGYRRIFIIDNSCQLYNEDDYNAFDEQEFLQSLRSASLRETISAAQLSLSLPSSTPPSQQTKKKRKIDETRRSGGGRTRKQTPPN